LLWFGIKLLLPLGLGIVGSIIAERVVEDNLFLHSWMEITTIPWVLGLLCSLGLIGSHRIRSRQKDRDEKLKAQYQVGMMEERRRFLQRLDHEMKNPLTAIRAGLANLAESPAQDVRDDALDSVSVQVLRLSNLVSDLRKLADLETRPLEYISVDVAALLEETLAAAQDLPDASQRQITLTVPQAPWPLSHIAGDWDLLFLAIYNLLDNAVKFTESGDTIEVRAFEDGSSVEIEVAETGQGIPQEDLPHVFEELYRGENARVVPGSGLGLALVRAIVERHDGQVSVRSRAGQGTVFTIRLPAGDVTRLQQQVAEL
jgi:two-component system OmpR family sensor kinase